MGRSSNSEEGCQWMIHKIGQRLPATFRNGHSAAWPATIQRCRPRQRQLESRRRKDPRLEEKTTQRDHTWRSSMSMNLGSRLRWRAPTILEMGRKHIHPTATPKSKMTSWRTCPSTPKKYLQTLSGGGCMKAV